MGLKVVEFSDAYFPSIDGVVNVVNNYMKVLSKENDCTLVVPKYPEKLGYVDNEPFKIFRCKSMRGMEGYRLALPGKDKELEEFLRKEKFDLIHVHSPFGLGKYAIKIGKKLGIPVVATMHTKYYDDILRIVKLRTIAKIVLHNLMKVYKKADSVWTVSGGACQSLRNYGYDGKVTIIPNGTELKYPKNAKELVEKVNKEHKLEGKKNVFLFIGRLALYKNVELILNSLKVLKDKKIDFTMLIVGSGFDEKKLKNLSTELGLDENVIFVGTVRDRTLLQGYYLRSDLMLFPSLFDTSGLVTIEEATHKLPTLAIKNTCVAENIEDEKNGFLAENTVESYSTKLAKIIETPKKLKEVGLEAYNTLQRSWEMVCADVVKNYKKVIKEYKQKQKEKQKKWIIRIVADFFVN